MILKLRKLVLQALSSLLGLHVFVVATKEDKQLIEQAAEFQPNDVY